MSATESKLAPITTANPLTNDELTSFRDIIGVPERNAFIVAMDQTQEALKAVGAMMAEIKNNNSNAQDVMLVLNHQNNAINKMADSVSDLAKSVALSEHNRTLAIDRLIESNKWVSDSIAKAIYVNAAKTEKAFSSVAKPTDINGLFYSTYSEENKNMWIQMIKGDVCSKCLESNTGDPKEFFSTLYSDMKKFDHYDVDSLLVEYKKVDPTADILKMCANSDALRLSVEKRINNIQHKKYVKSMKTAKVTKTTKAKSPKVRYLEANRCPSDIKALICKIAGTSHPAGIQYNKILNHILSLTNMEKADVLTQTKNKFNIGSCNVWFAVSKYPTLVNALQELAATK